MNLVYVLPKQAPNPSEFNHNMCCDKNPHIIEDRVRITQEKQYPQYFNLNFFH